MLYTSEHHSSCQTSLDDLIWNSKFKREEARRDKYTRSTCGLWSEQQKKLYRMFIVITYTKTFIIA